EADDRLAASCREFVLDLGSASAAERFFVARRQGSSDEETCSQGPRTRASVGCFAMEMEERRLNSGDCDQTFTRRQSIKDRTGCTRASYQEDSAGRLLF